MASKRVAFFYQTFTQQDNCLDELDKRVTDLYISSVHFGSDPVTKKPYIHLNDHPPAYFKQFFLDLDRIRSGCRVHIMIGGAGGGLAPLVLKPSIYLPMLESFLRYQTRITGINIDVEEPGITTSQVQLLVRQLHQSFQGYELSLSPIASPASFLEAGSFSIATFAQTPEAKWVRTYLVQMYSDFSNEALEAFVDAKLDYSDILVGTISDQFRYRMGDLGKAYSNMLRAHPNLGGAFDWEMYDAPVDWTDTIYACNNGRVSEEGDAVDTEWGMLNLCPIL